MSLQARHALLLFWFVFGGAFAFFTPLILFRNDAADVSPRDYWLWGRGLFELKFLAVFVPMIAIVIGVMVAFW